MHSRRIFSWGARQKKGTRIEEAWKMSRSVDTAPGSDVFPSDAVKRNF